MPQQLPADVQEAVEGSQSLRLWLDQLAQATTREEVWLLTNDTQAVSAIRMVATYITLLEREALAHLRSRQQQEQAERELNANVTGSLAWKLSNRTAERDALQSEVDALRSAKDAAEARADREAKGSVSLQQHRDRWRGYAYGKYEKPDDFLDGNLVDRPITRIEELEARCQAVASEMERWAKYSMDYDAGIRVSKWAKQLQEPSR